MWVASAGGGSGAGKVAAPGLGAVAVLVWEVRPACLPGNVHAVGSAPPRPRSLVGGFAPEDLSGRGGGRGVSPGKATWGSASDLLPQKDDS